MKAAYINAFGGPEVVEFGELEQPHAKGNEIVIENHIIGVGKPDYLVRSGNDPYLENSFPNLIIGNESAGVVVEVGPDVKNFKIGDKVSILNGTGCGSHAEYSCATENFAIKLADGVEPEMVPGILNLQVAYALLFEEGRGSDNQSLYIQGAAGGLGTILVQMAKSAGLQVVASASNQEKCDVLAKLGCDHVFNYKECDVKEEVLKATNGRGVDLIYDQRAGKNFSKQFEYLADYGKIIMYNWLEGSPELDQLDTIIKQAWHGTSISSFSFHVYDNKMDRRMANANKCFDMIRDGRVKPYVFENLPLSEARKAHELLDSGKVIGKLVMHP